MSLRALISLFCAAVLAWCLLHGQEHWEYDSQVVNDGLQDALKWWEAGHHGRMAIFGGFPPFQYLTGLPTVALARKGIGLETYGWWIFLNRLSLAGCCLLFVWAGRRRGAPVAGRLLVAALLSGALTYYSTTTFNEATAGFVTLAFTAACCARWPTWAKVGLFVLAGTTKETAAPLLLLLWVGALLAEPAPRWRREAVWVIVGTAIAMGLNAGFNVLRFGTPKNLHYLSPGLVVQSWRWKAQYAASLWFAPNGGILWFCPAVVALVGLAARRFGRNRIAPALLAATVMVGVTAMLSCWYSPFGWWCWGPRLALPWIPSVVFLLLWSQPGAFEGAATTLAATAARKAALAAVLVTLAVPHVLLLVDAGCVREFFVEPEPARPADPVVEEHMRILFEAWRKTPWLLLRPVQATYSTKDLFVPAAFLAALAGWVLALPEGTAPGERHPGALELPPGALTPAGAGASPSRGTSRVGRRAAGGCRARRSRPRSSRRSGRSPKPC